MANTVYQAQTILVPLAENGDKATIPLSNDPTLGIFSQNAGFTSANSASLSSEEGKDVRRVDVNGAFNLVSGHIYQQECGRLYTFDSSLATQIGGYALGALLWYKDSNDNLMLLRSTKNANSDNFVDTPSYIGDSWEIVTPTVSDVSNRLKLDASNATSATKKFFDSSVMPNYSGAISVSSSPYTAPTNGFMFFELPQRMVGSISIGGLTYNFSYYHNYTQNSLAVFPLAIAQTITFSGTSNAKFVPCLGG